ncbi:MAG: tRNA pseudouridine(55) synthase TruB [Alphaproteobacteria bacterium]|nr:tRNA pseudouridine(55) synthase TruB [Alphaproteobacteria bacterium]
MAQNPPAKKRPKRNVSGWLVLDKPYDMTSTEAVGKVRWLFSAKKAGHAGTLDPLATGVLPIALGEATKTVPPVQDGTKIYRFDLAWGRTTTTGDAEGETLETSNNRPSEAEVRAALPEFTGTITQVPPAFSAIKINGERAYDLARAGKKVDMPEREVEITRFELLEHGPERSRFEVTCAKGTYIRALARDLAEHLGTKGYVAGLHRAAVGAFTNEIAVNLDDLEAADLEDRDAMLAPVASGLAGLVEITVDQRQAVIIRLGNPVLLTGAGAPISVTSAWASLNGEAIALGFVEKGQFKPKRVILAH